MDKFFFTDIPTWRNGVWEKTSFETQVEFYNFLEPLFKEPGQYQFDDDDRDSRCSVEACFVVHSFLLREW